MTDILLDTCNCLDADSFFSKRPIPRNTTYCASFAGLNVSEVVERLRCSWNVVQANTFECVQQCPDPCTKLDYEYTHSFARWPSTFNKLNFYNEFVRNSSLDMHADAFAEIEQLLETNYSEGIARLINDHWIEENFLQLVLADTQTSILLIEDVAKMSAMNFVALLGGILNLYSGLTIVVIVELLEALIHLLVPCCAALRGRLKGSRIQTTNKHDEKLGNRQCTVAWANN